MVWRRNFVWLIKFSNKVQDNRTLKKESSIAVIWCKGLLYNKSLFVVFEIMFVMYYYLFRIILLIEEKFYEEIECSCSFLILEAPKKLW